MKYRSQLRATDTVNVGVQGGEGSALGRMRYQILGMIIFVIIVPFALLTEILNVPFWATTQKNTLIGTIFALFFGFFSHRRLGSFPGITAGSSIIPVFSVSYSVIVLVFFFFRLEYSTLQFAFCYFATLAFFFFVHFFAVRKEGYTIGVVPGGATMLLHNLDGVVWRDLHAPDTPRHTCNAVVADLRADLPDKWQRMIADCALQGIPVFHVKQVIEQLTGRVEIEHFSENTLGSLNPNQAYIKFKDAVDWISALVGVIILSPILILVAVLIRMDSPGPSLFRQVRMGFRGQPFTVFKFRTMTCTTDGVEDERSAAMTKDNDARITRLGSFLRQTRIDELPQMINILRGEMSWIGPRPEALPLTRWYESEIPFYHYRHIVRPGITGWAQVNQGHVANVDEVRGKLNYDFYYIKNFSFWLDILIVMQTFRTMVTGSGAR